MNDVMGVDRGGNERDWRYIGDQDILHGGSYYDVESARGHREAIPDYDDDPAAFIKWAYAGVDHVEVVRVSSQWLGLDDAVLVEDGSVVLREDKETFDSILKFIDTSPWDLPADPQVRLMHLADATASYAGIDADRAVSYQTNRAEGMDGREGQSIDHRVRHLDIEDIIKREFLYMGDVLREEDYIEKGVVVCDLMERDDFTCRWAYDRHRGELIACEVLGEDGEWAPATEALEDYQVRDLIDDLQYPDDGLDYLSYPEQFDNVRELDHVPVTAEFDGFRDPEASEKLGW